MRATFSVHLPLFSASRLGMPLADQKRTGASGSQDGKVLI